MSSALIKSLNAANTNRFIEILKKTPAKELSIQAGVIWDIANKKRSCDIIDALINLRIKPATLKLCRKNLSDLGKNTLYSSVKWNNKDAFDFIIANNTLDITLLSYSLVHISSKVIAKPSIEYDMALLLLKEGADPNYLDRTPLLNASVNACAPLVGLLVEYGAVMSFFNSVELYLSVNKDISPLDLLARGIDDEKPFILSQLAQQKSSSFFEKGNKI